MLCEKPFTINARQAEEVAEAAARNNCFLMEGMWSRFFPAMQKVRDLLAEGAIGKPMLLEADFGFRAGFNPNSRLFDPAMGGGALMDVGVYCVSLASMFFGTPDRAECVATLCDTGVDEQAVMLLGYPNGSLAHLSTAIRLSTVHAATLFGEEGSLVLPSPWWKPTRLELHRNGKTEEFTYPFESTGFQFEAAEACRCLNEGLAESPVLPIHETLQIMRTLDTLRSRCGVRYPAD